jgi:hypothetical protein
VGRADRAFAVGAGAFEDQGGNDGGFVLCEMSGVHGSGSYGEAARRFKAGVGPEFAEGFHEVDVEVI